MVIGLLPPVLCGCPSLSALPDQAPVVELTTDSDESPYLLYVPSIYDERREWPLVIVCHGTWPYDTAELQMREWAGFAEQRGIIVAAPKLAGTQGDLPPPPERQIALQRDDERAILSVVEELKRRYRIAESRVFMTGWSAGAYAILHTGLRHPDVFRALYIRQGTFDARFLLDVRPESLDDWQLVKVVYGRTDLLRDQAKACMAWLREQGLHVDKEELAGTHRRIDPKLPWDYFTDVAKHRLWVRIRAWTPDPDDPLSVRFTVDGDPPIAEQKWFFGDGDSSYEPSPLHTYESPDRYEVTVNVRLRNGKKYARRRVLQIGRRALAP